jgi:predicted metal-dependent peptidase
MSTKVARLENGQKVTLINPVWDKDTPCIPTSLLTPAGPHKLTIREAQKRLDDVRHYCIIKSPAFASVAASVRHIVLTPVSDKFKHVAFTDGWSVWYGGGFFQEKSTAQAAIVIHEVLHVALRHPQRAKAFMMKSGHPHSGKNFRPDLWNLACDAIVNMSTFALKWTEKPRCGVVTFDTLLPEAELKTWPAHRWSTESLYVRLCNESGGSGSGVEDFIKRLNAAMGAMRGEGGDIDPDTLLSDVTTVLEEVKADTDANGRNWSSRLSRAAAGDTPSGFLRQALFDNPTTKTPWQTYLRRWLTASVMPTTEPHTNKPSRHMLANFAFVKKSSRAGYKTPYDPGIQPSKGIKRIVVCVDTSGSIDDEMLAYFCAEIQTIKNRVGAEIVLIACDAAVHDILYIGAHENLKQKILEQKGGIGGGGGTDFRPAVAAAEKIKGAAVCVYLTDMCGPFPTTSAIPLIWAATMEPATEPQVGKVILMKN